MSSMQSADPVVSAPLVATAPLTGATPLPAALVLLLASGAGLAAASLYYSQPMLGVLGADIGASARTLRKASYVS